MSKPRYDWWGYVKGMIRRYPGRRGLELHGVALSEFEAVRAAVEATERMESGEARLKVVDMVLWKQTHTLEGAALMVPCSYETAKRWQQQFIKTTARSFRCNGLTD